MRFLVLVAHLVVRVPLAMLVLFTLPHVRDLVTPAPDLNERLIAEASARPPAPPPVHLDVRYRRTIRGTCKLDIYEPTAPYVRGSAPVLVFYPGGSWVQSRRPRGTSPASPTAS